MATSLATTNTTNAQVTAANTKAAQSKAARTGFGDDFNSFLNLLTTQLRNQDPLSPLDTNQFTQQLVSFSQVEQAISTNEKLTSILDVQAANQTISSLGLVGETVEVEGAKAPLQGGKASFVYDLGRETTATALTIRDERGFVVWQGEGDKRAGRHVLTWNGKNSSGAAAPDGVYTLEVAPARKDDLQVSVKVTGIGRVTGVETVDKAPSMNIAGLKVPVSKLLAIRDESLS